jgi:hypothetical protein
MKFLILVWFERLSFSINCYVSFSYPAAGVCYYQVSHWYICTQDKQIRAEAAREVGTDVDFLAPYFARIGNPEKVSKQQALQIREDCIADFKQLFLDRINKIQNYFEEVIIRLPLLLAHYHSVT